MDAKKRLAIDFDGVLVPRDLGPPDGPIPDDAVPGAFAALRLLAEYFNVYVLTARKPIEVVDWLEDHGIKATARNEVPEWCSQRGMLLVTNTKHPSVAYVDDRAIRFESWEQTLSDLAKYTR